MMNFTLTVPDAFVFPSPYFLIAFTGYNDIEAVAGTEALGFIWEVSPV